MSLLEDIQNSAIDNSSDLGTLLRKTKVLAARLGSQPLEDWLLYESNGYPEEVELPNYRVWPVQLKGHFAGPFGASVRHAPIPTLCVPEKLRERFTIFRCRQSIASVEELLRDNESGMMQTSVGDLSLVLSDKVIEGYNCMQAWSEFGGGHMLEVLNTVRNRILDLVLGIWKEDPDAGSSNSPAKIETQTVTQIFNTTVYGGAASVIGTAQQSSISINVRTGDTESLKIALQDAGIVEEDVDELIDAVLEEPALTTDNRFGPKVTRWMSNMYGKAANGLWDISVAAAGGFLSTAISQYYGLQT